MSDILVSGLINIEVTLRVDAFPIPYIPVRYPFFGMSSTVSGVGYNVARALTVLGDAVHLVSMVGQDLAADQVRRALDRDGISGDFILDQIRQTPYSVILYDGDGRRQINVDLKDVQEQTYPEVLFDRAIVFASYKIGETGAAEGFLDERGLNDLIEGVRRES